MKRKYDVERGLITKLIETKDIITLKDKQMKPSYFSGDSKKAFSFIMNTYDRTGQVPTLRVFSLKFPKYELEEYIDPDTSEMSIGTEEPLIHWCDEMRKKVKHNKIADVTESMAKHLEEDDSEKAYELMKKGVLLIENEIEESTSIDITQDTLARKAEYIKRKENQGLIGIPMNIVGLDNMLKGQQNMQLITMIASTGIGKTWFECLLGAYAMLAGYRVLQFVTEMSEDVMRDRYEAVIYGKIIGDFDYSRFKSGKLTPLEEESYFDFLEVVLPKLEPLIIETANGVSSVSAKIDQYKPDLVFIDGVYLMEDEQGAKEDWLRVAHITRDLKLLAKRKKKPIFINSQADSTTSKKTGPELENIGYSRAIGQDSDVVMALFQDEQMREDNEMKVKILKQREGVLGSVMLNWDFRTMNFDSIYSTEQMSQSKADTGVIDI